jgi:hypothetical protein
MSETKQPFFFLWPINPLYVQASFFNSTPTANNKKNNSKINTPTPARGAPHQYKKGQIIKQ